MYFRCADCLATHWVERSEPLRDSDAVACSACGRIHEARPVPALGSTLGSHYRRTFEFANALQIDMPSAYSILLGFTTLNAVRAAQGFAAADPDRKAGGAPGDTSRHTADGESRRPLFPGLNEQELELLERFEVDDAGALDGLPVPDPDDSTEAALFADLTDEELNLLDRLAIDEGNKASGGSEPIGESQAPLFPDLGPDELSLLEQLEDDDVARKQRPDGSVSTEAARDALFPDLNEKELGLLEGIFLEDAPEPEIRVEREVAASRAAGIPQASLLPDLDPGFLRAIARGHLTIQEALNRGSREAYAGGIAARHRLPLRLAYAVADNRIPLRKALLFCDAARQLRRPAPTPAREGAPKWSVGLVIGIGAAMVALATYGLWSRNFEPARHEIRRARAASRPAQSTPGPESASIVEPPTHRTTLRSLTQVLTNETGQATQVVGSDPGSVLLAYCENRVGIGFLEPQQITETVPPSREARLGVFRDLQSLTANFAIRIRRDRQSRRWIAGDGVHPIQVMQQFELPPGGLRVSLDPR